MKQVKFVSDYHGYATGEVAVIDDQLACGAISEGAAVPNIDPMEPPEVSATPPEVDALDQAPENAAVYVAPETK